jgi:hypothetical protein
MRAYARPERGVQQLVEAREAERDRNYSDSLSYLAELRVRA